MIKRRSLGQHFLISNSIAHSIVEHAKITKDDVVLEIGTGKGILTPLLCSQAKQVVSIEKDPVLYEHAKDLLSTAPNLSLQKGDAFKKELDFTILVSNLPYSESRTAIEWLAQRKFKKAVLMVQQEFFNKLLVGPGSKQRRAISVIASHCFDIKKLMDVGAKNFQPPPKVESAVFSISQKNIITLDIIQNINRLFSFKRKTLRHIGKKLGIDIDSDKRLEEISDEEVIELAKRL